jgi:hypothetical protein
VTVVDRPVRDPSRPVRLWAAPVGAHLAGLAVVLLCLLPVVGTSGAFMPDEGAAVIQARSLARGDGWIVEHPLPEADPGGRHYPLALGEEGSRGVAPLGKHPLYPLLLAAAYRVGGVPAMFLLSVLGTVAAAGFAAALARRIEPALARPALWVVGLASPLVFDGYLLVAHSLGAAASTAAVVAAVVAVEGGRRRAPVAVAPAVVVAVLLRNEARLFVGALVVVLAATAARRRDTAAAAVAVVVAVAAGAAHLAERGWIARIVGSEAGAPVPPFRHGDPHFLRGRANGLVITWFTPGQSDAGPVVVVALVAMVGALAVGALRVRLHPDDRRGIVVPAVAAAAAAVVAVVVQPGNVVPGLLVAFPLVVAGLLLDRGIFRGSVALLAAATAGLFTLAVLATQYPTGGTGEWGGRYFAIAVPVAVPVLLLALLRAGRRLPPGATSSPLAALVVCSLAMSVMAVASHRARVRSSTVLAASVVAASERVGDARPVVVTTDVILPRLAWPAFDEVRWLLASPDQVEEVVGALRQAGVDRFGLVTATPERERRRLRGADVVSTEALAGAPLAMVVVDARG